MVAQRLAENRPIQMLHTAPQSRINHRARGAIAVTEGRGPGDAARPADDTPPWRGEAEALERVRTPRGELQLQRRGGEFELISGGVFLMAGYNRPSQEAMARLALDTQEGRGLRLAVGGLGLGLVLRPLRAGDRVAHICVVEIEPTVVRWNRTWLRSANGGALDDPRVEVVIDDFAHWMEARASGTDDVPDPGPAYDIIIADTDNGPDWLVRPENARLYDRTGLRRLAGLLTAAGTAAFWSAAPSPPLAASLAAVFDQVTTHVVPDGPAEAAIYLAQSPLSASGDA